MKNWIMFALLLVTIPAPASAGWYLLGPNQVGVEEAIRRHPNLQNDWEIAKATLTLDEPFSRWEHVRSFDTAGECEEYMRKELGTLRISGGPVRTGFWRILARLGLGPREKEGTISDFHLVEGVPEKIQKDHPKLQGYLNDLLPYKYSRCIASDDPRLRDQGSRPGETKNTASRASTHPRVAPKQFAIRPVPGFPGLESAPLPK